MDIPLLAQALATLLAQSLPTLLGAGEKAAGKAVEEAGKQAGAAVSDKVREIWKRLRGEVEARPAAAEAVEDVAQMPADPDALATLRGQLRKILAADPELAATLAPLAEAARSEISVVSLQARDQGVAASHGGTAAREIAIGRDVHGNVIHITAGAGLLDAGEVLRWLGRPRPPRELEKVTERYLRHLVERYQYLEFRGLGVSDRVPLRLPLLEMYVPLTARVETPEGETWERLRLAGRRAAEAEAEALGRGPGTNRPVLDLLREHAGLILLGDPGSGKTTFLKLLALTLATGQGEKLGLGERLPVLVPLSAYADVLASGDLPLVPFLSRYYQSRGVDLPLDAILEPALEKGRVLLLLDGLDEVRDLARRHLLVERFKDFYAFHKDAGNKLVLTSRIVGYREARPEAPGLVEGSLADFDDADIEAFVGKWTAALERAASGATQVAELDARREREELLAAVHRNPGVRALATNPLLLTILAVMKRQGVTLPERRVALYDTCVKTLLRDWNLARSLTGRSVVDLDEEETLKVLAPLALWMHETSPGIGLVKEWDLERRLEGLCRERGHPDAEKAARRFLEDVHEHTALLLDRGGGQYGFIHLTFQEYLAGMALAKLAEQEVGPLVAALAEHAGDPAWHEVSLLAIGYLGIIQRRDGAASDVLAELLGRAPGPPGEAVVLAGRAVADMRSGGVTPACRERVLEALLAAMRSDQVEPPRRAAAGLARAEIGDPRPEVTTVDGMHFCRVPAGPFRMGSEKSDEQAFDDEKPAHDPDLPYGYLLGRYPVTVAQFREYVEASGTAPGDPDSLKGPATTPVVWVSWEEALGFCRWLTSRWREKGWLEPGWEVSLPSEAEWEKAARGGYEVLQDPQVGPVGQPQAGTVLHRNPSPVRRYPWGDPSDPNRSNVGETGIDDVSPLGCFPGGRSPYGCEEMSGNVWEWTRSVWGETWEKPAFPYPYRKEDGRENLQSSGPRVVRGGSCFSDPWSARCAFRNWLGPDLRSVDIGFRVVVLPFSSGL